MRVELTLPEILQALPEGDIEGDIASPALTGISSLEKAVSGDLAFLGNPKYRSIVPACKASLILLPEDYIGKPQDGQGYLRIKDPSRALAVLCSILERRLFPPPPLGIHETAHVEESAKIANSASIGAFSYIGEGSEINESVVVESHVHIGNCVKIRSGCRLFSGVKVLAHCELGQRVTLNAGVVVGSEGYGFDQVEGNHEKIPHLGTVVIEDDVEIGANSCIDRSRFAETRIGAGTKIDNLVQIGHNVVLGKRCLVVAQVGISGSVTFEDDVVVGGQAGFAGHLTVGRGAKIAGQAGITKDVESGAFLKGNPALPVPLAQRIAILQRKLPDLFKRFAEIDSKS